MALRVLVLSEDTGKGSVDTLAALFGRAVKTREHGLEAIELRPELGEGLPCVGSNFWRAKKGHRYADERRRLCVNLAGAVGRGEIVLFHSDADATWSSPSQNLSRDFDRLIRTPVRQHLSAARERSQRDETWVDDCLSRLVHVVPSWSIEAWTYQTTTAAQALCHAEYGGRDADKFAEWAQDRSLLDEVRRPKDETCLTNKHNPELAKAMPAAEVHAVGKSFAEFVTNLRAIGPLAGRMKIER